MTASANALMFQGTGSDVGKSVLVAGLCRAAKRRGLSVAPFKPQNMSNNAAATPEGGEIGRAQALQAIAAGRPPSIHMNPILLKPESDSGSQVIVQGRLLRHASARGYQSLKPALLESVVDSYRRLAETADLILVEGAGSPAEINLRSGDIANMGFAEAVGCPVVLVGDIERGGVIASLVGTAAVISETDRAHILGFVVNKFRGDVSLFVDGLAEIACRTGWAALGVVPWFADAWRLPAEDSVGLSRSGTVGAGNKTIKVAVPALSRIANFDDLDPLRLEPSVTVQIVEAGRPLPGDADVVLLAGSKATIADLHHFRAQGWDIDLAAHVRRGGHVLGLCGGYQMLGRGIKDPSGIEGPPGAALGLGLLDVDTVLTEDKTVRPISGVGLPDGIPIKGYEIHVGRTAGPDAMRPMLRLETPEGEREDGARSRDGRVEGCYVHGLLGSDAYRRAWLDRIGGMGDPLLDAGAVVEETLDGLAAHLEATLDLDRLFDLARPIGPAMVPTGFAASRSD